MGKIGDFPASIIDLSGLPLNNYGVDPTRRDDNVHTEGYRVNASGDYSHAEGYITSAANYAHSEGNNTRANGSASHAEGEGTVASGDDSHVEGKSTMADGNYSHAEGRSTKAYGLYSHAEGDNTIAGMSQNAPVPGGGNVPGEAAHAEGRNTTASANCSHAEGYRSTANAIGSHAEGNFCNAANEYSHAEGNQTKAIGKYCHTEGNGTSASNEGSHAEGYMTTASAPYSHVEGMSSEASGGASHAEGLETKAEGINSHAEGWRTTASGDYSHTEGMSTEATSGASHAEGASTHAEGMDSHAEGSYTYATGNYAHAEGANTYAKGWHSHAAGNNTYADSSCQTVIGMFNVKPATDSAPNRINYDAMFVIGSGATDDIRKNCFRVGTSGVFAAGEYASSGADYAEMFEWEDGNPNHEDRLGLFVTLRGNKIRPATSSDDFILGIVSGNPSVLGDVYDDQWKGMYQYDIFGQPIWEDVEITDEDGNKHTQRQQKLNPDYNPNEEYIPRTKRPEWSAVGMLGKLVATDDGSCVEDGWCKTNDNGVATNSTERTRYRVMKRLDNTHIQILIV